MSGFFVAQSLRQGIALLMGLPWSLRYRGLCYRLALGILVVGFGGLMKTFKYLFMLLLCAVSLTAQAALHRRMYSVDLPVSAGQQSVDLTVKAWGVLLPKLTGRRLAHLPSKLTKPRARVLSDLVDRYYYRNVDGERQFHVVFSLSRVNALLAKYQVPLWTRDRPPTLLWAMSVAPDGSVSLLTMDSPAIQQVSVLAQDRGYPLVFPIGDLSDEAPLKSMAAAVSSQALETLAKRYHVHRLLVVRLKEHAASEWVWWANDDLLKQWQQPYQAPEDQALSDGLDRAISFESARRDANTKHVLRSYPLVVLGVDSFADSESLLHELSEQHAAYQWKHEGLDNDGMHITLSSSYSMEGLRRQLRRIKGLTPLFHKQQGDLLVYVWGDVSPEKRDEWKEVYAVSSPIPNTVNATAMPAVKVTDDTPETVASYAYHSEDGFESSSEATPKTLDQPTTGDGDPNHELKPATQDEETHD